MTLSSKAIAACALMILLGLGIISYRSTVRNEEDRGWVTHTHLVVEKIQAVSIDLTQAESEQRGYILSGDEKYLEPYQASLDRVHRDIEGLQKLTSDNPRQEKAIQRLELFVAARIASFAHRIETRKRVGVTVAAEAVAKGNESSTEAEQTEVQIWEMRSTEEQLLAWRLQTEATDTRRMKAIIVLGNALAILILLAAGFVIHRESGKRNLAEDNLKSANERLERRTSQLSETNIELESFAYSVAHDLRAPLRHMTGYSNLLSEDYGPQLDAEGRRCLGKIADSAQKMGRLVDDLLCLSKIGRQALLLQATPLDVPLQQAVEELVREDSGRKIEWRIGELFSAECDPGLMKQVFVNLLSNAVKYSGKRAHAVIEVGQILRNGERVVFVRDNGVGFEMQYVGKLFGVFQRLHKSCDFDGTGVGLAIVQRIIRKHGGRIWAEAEVDQGATFFFTLGLSATKTSREIELSLKDEVMHV
jgi:signal transduction histidine kinase